MTARPERLTAGKEPAALPAAYAPFLPVMDRLSEPLQQVLGGQLLQFERFARSIEVQRFAPQGEFEGLDGLTMRGEVTHIVQSELLLRTEAPLEFLRRLAEAETLYHQKSYADPGARSIYRAMVSIGSGVLGHGRLVALAALFFMARVAHARGAHFHWCCLPREDGAIWFEELSVNTVKRFMRAVSYREMDTQDVAEAQALWTRLEPAALVRDTPDHIDWIVGAGVHPAARRDSGRAPAAASAANAICYTPLAPVTGSPREAMMLVRRGGKDVERTQITFPDERICVSAIRDPFKPQKPAATARALAIVPEVPRGWEPLYFSAPRANTKLVRMPDGLLLFILNDKRDLAGSWFVPLGEGVTLAGVMVEPAFFSIAVQARRGSRERVALRGYALWGPGSGECVGGLMKELATTHLFRSQRPYAIPPMHAGRRGTEIYSSFGQEFSFRSPEQDGLTHFEMLHGARKVLHASATDRVVRVEEAGGARLRVLKHLSTTRADFVEGPDKVSADRLLGMTFSPSDGGLAYSLAPGRWVIPPLARHAGPGAGYVDPDMARHHELQLEPSQQLLTGRIVPAGISARIWSDARRGGDGNVRTLRRHGDEMSLTNKLLRLGEDAETIANIQFGDDGFWAITVGDDGAPRELLNYRLRNSATHCRRFELARLAQEAIRLELDPFDD